MKSITKLIFCSLGLSLGSLSALSYGMEITGHESHNTHAQMIEIIEQGLPEIITNDNRKLARLLLAPENGVPLKDSFDQTTAIDQLFAGENAKYKKNCILPSADYDCTVFSGKAQGTGAYKKLSIRQTAKQIDLRYANRIALSNKVRKISLSDADAFSQAVDTWTQLLGVPKAEIPVAPADAKNPFPVKTLYVEVSDGIQTVKSIKHEKLVSVQRGLFVGGELGWVPGPGRLKMTFNEAGIVLASVQNWADMSHYGEGLNPDRVKSRKQLVNELVLLFQTQGIHHVHSAKSLFAIAQLDNKESTVEPVLRVFISPQPRDADELTQSRAISTAGIVVDLPLLYGT